MADAPVPSSIVACSCNLKRACSTKPRGSRTGGTVRQQQLDRALRECLHRRGNLFFLLLVELVDLLHGRYRRRGGHQTHGCVARTQADARNLDQRGAVAKRAGAPRVGPRPGSCFFSLLCGTDLFRLLRHPLREQLLGPILDLAPDLVQEPCYSLVRLGGFRDAEEPVESTP